MPSDIYAECKSCMQSATMLSVIMLSVKTPSDVAPFFFFVRQICFTVVATEADAT
jgi:hypothetical protein